MNLVMKKGTVAGREHIIFGLNCQDSLLTRTFVHNGFTYYIGAVADGCSEGLRSEVGASLGVAFTITKIEELILSGVPVKEIPKILYPLVVNYLRLIAGNFQIMSELQERRISFIKEHLLFTLLGFVIGPEDTVAFASGDGVVVMNDLIDMRDENDRPSYLAYHLVHKDQLEKMPTSMPEKFDVYELKTAELETLAVGTDSWLRELEALSQIIYSDGKLNVQTTMNLLSKGKKFKDDATIIMVKGG